MFFDEERILSVREMILSKTTEDRAKALEKLLPHQKKDFIEIFKIMSCLPVTVRLLDPPLHEFLPRTEKEINEPKKFGIILELLDLLKNLKYYMIGQKRLKINLR